MVLGEAREESRGQGAPRMRFQFRRVESAIRLHRQRRSGEVWRLTDWNMVAGTHSQNQYNILILKYK